MDNQDARGGEKVKYFNREVSGDGSAEHIFIYGDITSWRWDESDVSSYTLAKLLSGSTASEIVVHINSPGGEVPEALAIYSALRMKADAGVKVTTVTDGIAASAASMIFMAGTERVMFPYSMLFLHRIMSGLRGNAAEHRAEAETLEQMEASVYSVYRDNISIGDDALNALLDDESWINADDALTMGFSTVTRPGSPVAASICNNGQWIIDNGQSRRGIVVGRDALGATKQLTTGTGDTGDGVRRDDPSPTQTALQKFLSIIPKQG